MSLRRVVALSAALSGLVLTGCGANTPDRTSDGGGGGGMHGNGYRSSSSTCRVPTTLPGTVVRVTLGDMGMSTMMGGDAPMGARMRLRASTTRVAAGTVSFVVVNRGWRTHELVVLPLEKGASAGQRVVAADGRVSEAGDLGEASRECGADSGEGITSGSAGWTTLTLPAGRYELVCNLKNHYANGMRQAIDVS